jgi:pimeloyl-ACP methyl ester carboxylesterase
MMQFSSVTDGFRLAYDRTGSGKSVVLLHGWPGDRTDYNLLVPKLAGDADIIVPDLRGFGESDKHLVDPALAYSPIGQATAVIALLDELGVKSALLAGYDVGSLVAQTVARLRPDLVGGLVVSPPLPGAGERVLELQPVKEFWYTSFHQLQLSVDLLDGNAEGVRKYLRHFWSHWSGPNYVVDERRIEHLVSVYSPRGAFEASLGWYRSVGNPVTAYAQEEIPAASERLTTPTTILWQEFDAIFPRAFSDRLDKFFTNYELELLDGVGHFTPIEATDRFGQVIKKRLGGV